MTSVAIAPGSDNAARPSVHSIRTISRNTLWTLFSTGGPLLIGVVCIPKIVHSLDPSRYGLLTLCWSLIGYFALLDLGLGRAITHAAVRTEDDSALTGIPAALLFLACIGGVASVGLMLAAPAAATSLAPADLRPECVQSIRLLALAIPFITVSSGVRGLLEADHQFRLVALVRFAFTTFTYLGPAVTVFFSNRLVPIAIVLSLSRILGGATTIALGWAEIPWTRKGVRSVANRSVRTPIANFAIWTTLFNLVTPLLVYGDRFVVTAMVSAAAVGFYATPFEVLARFSLIPAALSGVLFPSFSGQWRANPDAARKLLFRGVDAVAVTMFFACGAAVLLADIGLQKWLGKSFAVQSRDLTGWFAAGMFINGIAFVPVTFLQGIGRPDIPSKISLLELPAYGIALYFLVAAAGAKGAAIAWSVRVLVDCAAIFASVSYFDPMARRGLIGRLVIALTGFGALLCLRKVVA